MATVCVNTSLSKKQGKRNLNKENSSKSADVDWRKTKTAGQCLSYLCLSEHLSDITFTFEHEDTVRLHAHKFVLSMRSSVFEAMFHGPLHEDGKSVLIKDIKPETMKVLLGFIYTDTPMLNGENVLSTLYAAKKYALEGLVKLCSAFLEKNINDENVCVIHVQSVFYDVKTLETKCFEYILENAPNVLATQGFLKLSHATLHKLLQHDDLADDEVNIFNAAMNWAKNNCKSKNKPQTVENLRDSLGEALFAIRFPVLPITDFAKVVTPVGILTSEEQVMVYQYNALGGATAQSKFLTHERTGRTITIDVSEWNNRSEVDMIAEVNMFAEVDMFADHRGYNGIYHNAFYAQSPAYLQIQDTPENIQHKQPKNIRLKSVSGSFVEEVASVADAMNGVAIDYQRKGNSICFKEPVQLVIGGKQFLSFNKAPQQQKYHTTSFGLSMVQPIQPFLRVNIVKQVFDRSICISQIPRGIETITFIQ